MSYDKIELAFLKSIKQHPQMPLVIAYSGGVDSQVALHAIALLKHKKAISNAITVCHVNHGLSKNAYEWQVFAEQACLRLNLPLKICKVNVQAQAQQSLESLARDARYQALHSVYQEPSLIITGHHSDDQAETFLLALKRGSGLKGLSAMGNKTKYGKDLLLRPLLIIPRDNIVDYAKINDLTWVEDESNTDTHFDRNFIRNDIMPLLTTRWPSITNTINRSSKHCREGQLLLDELAADDLNTCYNSANSLIVASLALLSQKRFNNLIRYFLAKNNCLMPSTEQLAQLYQQLYANNDKNPAVKVGDNFIRRYKGILYLTAAFDDISQWQTDVVLSDIGVEKIVQLPDALGCLHFVKVACNESIKASQQIILPSPVQKVTVRFYHNNPTCLPDYRQHSRSLKKVLQELNIPTWQRKRIPFLYYDDIFVAAIGYFVCQNYLFRSLPSKARLPKEASVKLTISWAR